LSPFHFPALARCRPETPPVFDRAAIASAAARVRESAHVVLHPADGRVGVAAGGSLGGDGPYGWIGTLPPLFPEWLGDRSFNETHGTRFPYIAGAMANGIGSTAIVIAMARAGMLGFFGAAGLSLGRVRAAVDELQATVFELPHGCNLIHSPHEPLLEAGAVELYLEKGVRRVSASAFMGLTLPLVRYACSGITTDGEGRVHRKNHVFAKISRPEVARRFMLPAPREMLEALVRDGQLSAEEAHLALRLPIAEDVTVEADSGGHTDNRPLGSMFPCIARARDEIARELGYERPIRVGAAGGLGTPASVASAFALGAAYVLTGSVNQASIEAAISPRAKEMLCNADVADVTMAPAADMFELGVDVQVLKRGTMFAARGHHLRELYQRHEGLHTLSRAETAKLEKEILRDSCDNVWAETRKFWAGRDARQIQEAERSPKHKMALIFRWYLGKASRWAIDGDASRVMDYQIWCGPAQGAFNAWVKGSFLEPASSRTVVQIARNLLEGAAVITRAHQLRTYGVPVPEAAFAFTPRPLA
jgi:trans-AT polyketide synthase, acyltransferase and oxidoreductase domains